MNSVWIVQDDNAVTAFSSEEKANKYKAIYYKNDRFVDVYESTLDPDPVVQLARFELTLENMRNVAKKREIAAFRAKYPDLLKDS